MSEVLFFLYFPTKEIAEKFLEILVKDNFELKSLEKMEYDKTNDWSLRVTKIMDSDELERIDSLLIKTANKAGGIYDGYER